MTVHVYSTENWKNDKMWLTLRPMALSNDLDLNKISFSPT